MTQEEYIERLEKTAEKMILAAQMFEKSMKLFADLSGMQSENFTRAAEGFGLAYSETEFEKLKNSYYDDKKESPF